MKRVKRDDWVCPLCKYSLPAKGEEDTRPVCPACGHSTDPNIPSINTKWVVQRVRTYLEGREEYVGSR